MSRPATISMLLTGALIASAQAWAASVQVTTFDGLGKPFLMAASTHSVTLQVKGVNR